MKWPNVPKPTRYRCPEAPGAVLPSRQKVPRPCRRPPPWTPFGHPNSLEIALARAVCAKVRPGTPLNAKNGALGAQGCQKVPKWNQNGTKLEPKICFKSRFRKKMPKVVWTNDLLYMLTTGTLRKLHFLTPRSKQNAGLFRVVPRIPPRSCKVAPMGPKNDESGVPREHQGCQRVPQCLQKCSKK